MQNDNFQVLEQRVNRATIYGSVLWF